MTQCFKFLVAKPHKGLAGIVTAHHRLDLGSCSIWVLAGHNDIGYKIIQTRNCKIPAFNNERIADHLVVDYIVNYLKIQWSYV